MTQDFSIIHLLLNASWVVQAVVLLLMGVSVASWTAIFRKIISLKRFLVGHQLERVVRGRSPKCT
jgi:biopolymer transport protein TolQ